MPKPLHMRRAMAAANLLSAIARADGADAARAFYESELEAPNDRADAPPELAGIARNARAALGL